MIRNRQYRVVAALLALLTSVSTPGLAFALPHVHAHMAAEHGGVARTAGADTGRRYGADEDHDDDHGADHHNPAGHDTDHRDAADHDDDRVLTHAAEVDAPSHQHAHDHPSIEPAAASRDEARFGGSASVQSAAPCMTDARLADRRIPCAVPPTCALLARPGPDSGPPPNPRAPPTR